MCGLIAGSCLCDLFLYCIGCLFSFVGYAIGYLRLCVVGFFVLCLFGVLIVLFTFTMFCVEWFDFVVTYLVFVVWFICVLGWFCGWFVCG